jgi:hypothetical protein
MLEIYLPTLFVNHFANSVEAIIGATILSLTVPFCPWLPALLWQTRFLLPHFNWARHITFDCPILPLTIYPYLADPDFCSLTLTHTFQGHFLATFTSPFLPTFSSPFLPTFSSRFLPTFSSLPDFLSPPWPNCCALAATQSGALQFLSMQGGVYTPGSSFHPAKPNLTGQFLITG